MPTRFPYGLNAGLKHNTPLHDILSVNADAGQWGLYYNDFTSTAGLTAVAGSTGTCNLFTSNNVTGGEFGQLNCVTAATASDLQVCYLSSFVANSLALPFYISKGASTSNTAEWVFSTRVKLANANNGFWVGIVPSSAVYTAGAVDMSADTVSGVTTGILLHKAIDSAATYIDYYGTSAALITQTAMNSAASTTVMGFVAHSKGGYVSLYSSTQANSTAPGRCSLADGLLPCPRARG